MNLLELRYRRHHRSERLTRSGLLFFLTIIAIGAVAINSGNNLLYLVFSTLLSALIFSGFLSVANMRRVELTVDSGEDVFAGRPAHVLFRVRNRSSFPLFFVRCTVRSVGTVVSFDIPFVGSMRTEEKLIVATLPRRGRVIGLTAGLTSAFPFGIIEMGRQVDIAGELIVLPAALPVRVIRPYERGEHRLERARAGGDGDYFSLHAYREGDDARHINWMVTARRGSPFVVENEARYQDEMLFYLETALERWTDDAAFEEAVTLVASGITQESDNGAAVALAMPGVFLEGRDRRSWRRIMECLAVAETSHEPLGIPPGHSVTPEMIVREGKL